jgi:Ca2+-binding EF-hand superfamily protein
MMNIKHMASLFLVCTALAAPAPAQGPGEEAVLKRAFQNYDRNKDGTVTREEFPGSDIQFGLMDADKNKQVTYEEFKASPLAKRLLASRRRDMGEPRERVTLEQLAYKRLQNLARFDTNKDGKVTLAEWTGTEAAFKSLDLDFNGVLDKKDRNAAKVYATAYEEPGADLVKSVRSRLPGVEELLKLWDKNKDGQLAKTEVPRDKPLYKLFDNADANGDKQLDERELRYAVGRVNEYVNMRNAGGYRRERAWDVPFAAWDKNKDGRLDTKEWVEKKNLFKRIDVNRDAHVTRDEVERYKRSVEGENFIQKHDLNGDGRVSLEEFGGSPDAFRRADRNGDGYISSRDK